MTSEENLIASRVMASLYVDCTKKAAEAKSMGHGPGLNKMVQIHNRIYGPTTAQVFSRSCYYYKNLKNKKSQKNMLLLTLSAHAR